MPSRRQLLLGTAVAAAGAYALRPADHGGPAPAYFQNLARALAEAGIAWPVMVIDAQRLQGNLAKIAGHVGGRLPLRVVAKSLPSLSLVDAALAAWQTQRAMVFNADQLVQLGSARPGLDVLMGKPLTAQAAQHALAQLRPGGLDPARQVQWLVDTPQRLAQYRDLARARQQPLRVNFEIDVGLHRGGIEDLSELAAMLDIVKQEPLLQWSGFMGYEAHVAAVPDLPGLRAYAWAEVHARYESMWQAAQRMLPALQNAQPRQRYTFNSGGSHTYRLHDGRRLPNEVSVGSAALLPSDFDQPALHELQPAAFIATPVLKAFAPFRLPVGVEWLSRTAAAWDRNQAQALCIHGGNWLADPVSPPGVAESGLYGRSSNQQLLVASASVHAQPGDFVFLRPRQSEAVLLQFGDLLVFDGRRITTRWPVFPVSA